MGTFGGHDDQRISKHNRLISEQSMASLMSSGETTTVPNRSKKMHNIKKIGVTQKYCCLSEPDG
jgi:hypothetical protein